MKKIVICALLIASTAYPADDPTAYIRAYPNFFTGYIDGKLIGNGFTIVYDDGMEKSEAQMLADADPQDQLSQDYPLGDFTQPLSDPGRFRCYALFDAMYGSTEAEISRNIVKVAWMTRKDVFVTRVNGVDLAIRAVSDELEKKPELRRYLQGPVYSYNHRRIQDSQLLSPHSYGIAIDICVPISDYWYNDRFRNYRYRNRIPLDIVEIFEKYGFIWGGKWYHYDTMHFEYRPELLIKRIAALKRF